MKLQYHLSKLAIQDINLIWNFTAEKWSPSQANKYYKTIFKATNELCKNPQLGKALGEVKQHHRILSMKSHLLIYKSDDKNIFIDRILHEKMDYEKIIT